VGALYVRKGTRLQPFMTGGSQERKRRAGTENVPGIVGLGAAARLAAERLSDMTSRIGGLRDRLERALREHAGGARVNGAVDRRVPNTTNLAFEGIEGESAVIALDLEGVAVSTGSACSSGSLEPSHVLVAMGLRPEVVQGSLRFSLSWHDSEADLDSAIDVVVRVLDRLRRLARRVSA
jgi:cysteine desulfurase